MNLEPLERYRPIVDDWSAFTGALAEPLPTCIVTNRLRIGRDSLRERLAARGVLTTPLAWTDDALVLARRNSPGNRYEYLAGLYNVQEEAAVIPVKILDPQPGERVLDMCAAPGNKTAQIAMAMGNRGTVIANDCNAGRMRAVRSILDRFGLANVAMTLCNGANYPNAVGSFDRVLVDVPCSCEGTSRKSPNVLDDMQGADHDRLGGLQRALLRRAFDLCAPGGRVVYSTCTYAPEENELVVDDVVRELPFDVQWLDCRLDHFRHAEGLTSWSGRSFDPRMSRAMRVWPHFNDTGGFFVAAFDKSPDAPPAPTRPGTTDVITAVDKEPWIAALRDRFGWDDLEGWTLFEPNRKSVCITSDDFRPTSAVESAGLGMSMLRKAMAVPKLTTAVAMLFQGKTKRHLVDLSPQQMDRFLSRQSVEVGEGELSTCDSSGYVLVRCEGIVAGVARLRRDGGSLESLYPKAWSLNEDASAFEDES